MPTSVHFVVFLFLFNVFAGLVRADVALSPLFSDHAVLQRGDKVPVWGTAEPGEQITVTAEGASAQATTGAASRRAPSI
jgi:hypothetical protein